MRSGSTRCLTAMFMVACAGMPMHQAYAQAGDGDAAIMPMDPAVSAGTLPNGLRYMVRRNALPVGRVEFRLVVNAGSALEDADQRGMAHFVEHMAFNGTTHFKKNALVAYLQSIGMRYGNDVNAQTSYDETIYELTVPTDGATIDSALTILADWASGVQFDSADVVAERNVILEEWRLRTGPAARVETAYDTVLYRGTPYLDRPPIGTVESIKTTNPAPLKRFYRDWYRPGLMSVIVVGDVDQATMVGEIAQRFGSLENPAVPRPRPQSADSLPRTPTAFVVRSPEEHAWSGTALFPRSSGAPGTLAAYHDARVSDMLLAIVNQRLAQLVQRPGSPLLSASLAADRLQHGEYVYELDVTAKPLQLDSGLTDALAEVDRIARDGVVPAEVDQQRKIFMRTADDASAIGAPRQSADLAAQYINNVITGTVSLSPAQMVSRLRETIPTITPADIRAVAASIRDDSVPLVLATVPGGADSGSAGATTTAGLLRAVAQARVLPLPPYDARLIDAPLVAYPPTPGKITKSRTIAPVGITEWTFANGVRVLLKPMRDGHGKVYVSGSRWGGVAMADSSDYASAATASLIGNGGVGTYSNDALQRKFAGVDAGVTTTIGDYVDAAGGQSGSRAEDKLLLFQLLYLKFTAPRVDSTVFARWKTQAQDLQQVNQLALYLGAYLRGGHAFGRPVIGPLADSVDIRRALAFYHSRFGDASGFTFVITGDFALDSIRPLVAQYLGGLPSSGGSRLVPSGPRDTGVRPSAGPVRHLILTDEVDPKAKTVIVYTTPVTPTHAMTAQVEALASTLQMRLTQRMRQQLGGVYVVAVAGSVDREPSGRAQVQIEYTADPARLDEMHAALMAELDSMRTVGPTAAELHDAKEQARRSQEEEDGRADSWAAGISTYVVSGWALDSVSTDAAVMGAVTISDVRALAQRMFTDQQRIEVFSMPKRFVTAK